MLQSVPPGAANPSVPSIIPSRWQELQPGPRRRSVLPHRHHRPLPFPPSPLSPSPSHSPTSLSPGHARSPVAISHAPSPTDTSLPNTLSQFSLWTACRRRQPACPLRQITVHPSIRPAETPPSSRTPAAQGRDIARFCFLPSASCFLAPPARPPWISNSSRTSLPLEASRARLAVGSISPIAAAPRSSRR